MNYIKYNNNLFNYYPIAKYPGKSILTGAKINVGDSIYWAKDVGGFLASEAALINANINTNTNTNTTMYHSGPVNSEWTYDDSVSREKTCKVFKREFGIDLGDHPRSFY